MRTTRLYGTTLTLVAAFMLTSVLSQAQLPFRPLYDGPVSAAEEQLLNSLFAEARAASASISPSPQAGFQRRQIGTELNGELEAFVATHTNSAWSPALRLWLARRAQLRCAYVTAANHFSAAWASAAGVEGAPARRIAGEALSGLAMSLAQAGRLDELDALEMQARHLGILPAGSGWKEAMELRASARKRPDRTYKCGLYSLDQLGRLIQPGQFESKAITDTASSVEGFTAADLVQIAARAGLRVRAARLISSGELPVPSIVHLVSEHFIVLRERQGAFYEVYDRALSGPRWLTTAEILQEASGCVIVSDATPPAGSFQLTLLSTVEAAAFRGRMIGGPYDHDDSPCPNSGKTDSDDAQGWNPLGTPPPPGCNCAGMPTWLVSEIWLSLWIQDTPLHYDSAYGPDVTLRLSYNHRHDGSVVSGEYWQGAGFGNYDGSCGLWACSWMSYAELSADEYTVDVLLPQGGWATFTFAAGSSVSGMNYRHNAWLEKVGSEGDYASLILHHLDGSGATYGLRNDFFDPYYRVYYRTEDFDPFGKKTTFTYDTNSPYYFGLTNVTAADGTSFTLELDDRYAPYSSVVTNITSSYGAVVSFRYSLPDYYYSGPTLTNITDAAGISSYIEYESPIGDAVSRLVTPYGTTGFTVDESSSLFDRSVRITNALDQQEFYGLIEEYTGGDWPAYSASQIPTNTPVGTLDSTERTNRNTFYWNAQQFAAYASQDLDSFNWTNFNSARIRHWLSSDDAPMDYTLSVQQEPSPSNTTNTHGQLTWFDYKGKPANENYSRGTQIAPSVIARVMPDGSTAYQYFERLTNGLPTKFVEKWASGDTALYRTNTFTYAANNVDMTLHVGSDSGQVVSNYFNGYHQVLASYDALNQETVYTYDGTTRQLSSISRPTSLTTTNIYNGNNRLEKTIDLQINRTNSYTWYSSGDLESHTSERSLSVTNYWDGLHRLLATKYPDGTTVSNFYTVGSTKLLDLTATKDRLGYWTYFGYDALRRKVAETNANGVVTRYGYCDCSGIGAVTNAWSTAAEFVTQFQYDYQGNRIYTFYPDATITNWFDSLQRRYLTADAWGSRAFYYDNLNRLTNTSNAYGTEQNTIFDVEDQPLYVTDANGVSVTNTYDALHRLLTRTYPDGGVEKFGYSARGLVTYTNQLNKETYYVYDEAMRKTWETNANNEIIRYTNNAAGDLLSLTDGKNQTTKWNYDEYGRVTNKVDQVGAEILRYKYDPDSRLTNRWSAAKTNTYYAYDPVGNLTNINYPASTDVKFQYDPLNRVTNMIDAAGTTKYAYTAGGFLWTEDGPFSNDTVTNGYTYRLRTSLALKQPTGVWTNGFWYDYAKRLTNVTSKAGTFAYILGGTSSESPLPKKLLLPNTSYITNTYDSVARLTGTWLKNSSHSTLNSHQYTYNPGNQRTQQVFGVGSTYNYTYDAIGQLKIADSGTASEDRGYTYDAAWNLNYRTNNTTLNTFTVNTKNELTNATPVGAQTYDGNGNLVSSYVGSQIYSYDDENRLATYERDHAFRSVFTYDGLGRLRQREEYTWYWAPYYQWLLQATVRYVYDGMRVIQERESNTPQVSYTRGTDLSGSLEGAGGIGGLLARSHGYSGGNWSTHNFYHADGNGNITYLVNSSQTLAASYRYDPYGNTISSSGGLASANVYRFSSKEIHVNSGLYYYGYRWYSPNLQRWLNRDPIGEEGGINLYGYVFSNPISGVDPYGLDACDDLKSWEKHLKEVEADWRKWFKSLKDATDEKEKDLIKKRVQDLIRREFHAKEQIERLKWPARRALLWRAVQGVGAAIITAPARFPLMLVPSWEYGNPPREA